MSEIGPQEMTLVQEAGEAMVILDKDGTVRFANPAAGVLLGCEAETLIGKPFEFDVQTGPKHEVRVVQPDGATRVAEIRTVETDWGGVPAYVASLTDITVRRRLEDAIEDAQTQREEARRRSDNFFANVSHDLRTPLTAIIGFSEIIKGEHLGPVGDNRYRQYVSDIHDCGEQLLTMIDDLLTIADLEAEKALIHQQPVALRPLIDAAISSVKRLLTGRDLSFDIDCPDESITANIDPQRVQQGLSRLLEGTGRAAPEGTVIKVTARSVGDYALIALTDFGQGTNDPYIAEGKTPSKPGVGYALARKVAEIHGGFLTTRADDGHRETVMGLPRAT